MATKSTQMTDRESQNQVAQQQHRARLQDNVLRPPVDIFEDPQGITVEADMPGVSKERLEVRVEGDTLLLEGKVQFDLPEGAEALYADVRTTTYRRTFQLSRELETEKIQANLKDGVLRVRIPKRAELQPRRIEVLSS
jgi:HSP20 family molecular chaperone IbpA